MSLLNGFKNGVPIPEPSNALVADGLCRTLRDRSYVKAREIALKDERYLRMTEMIRATNVIAKELIAHAFSGEEHFRSMDIHDVPDL